MDLESVLRKIAAGARRGPARSEPTPLSPDDPRLDGWYHSIELGPNIVTRGHFDLRSVVPSYGFPTSLSGKTALDVGTADGFFAFELERRGAKVVAMDLATKGDADWIPRMRARLQPEVQEVAGWPRRFALAHEALGSKVGYKIGSVYDLSPESMGRFDIVFCGSLLLHLQNPLGALIRIRSVTKEIAIVETSLAAELETKFGDRACLEFGAIGAEGEPARFNTFWKFSRKALHDMLIYAGFERVELQPQFLLAPYNHPVVCAHAYV